MTIPDALAHDFADSFNEHLAFDIATQLTCSEVEVLADLLTALECPGLATAWIDAHAEQDDPGDLHHRNPTPSI